MVRMILRVGLLLLFGALSAAAQDNARLLQIDRLIVEANAEIARLRSMANQAEASLRAWDEQLRRNDTTGSNVTTLSGANNLSTLSARISQHTALKSAQGTCRDDLLAIGQPAYRADALSRLPELSACADQIRPQVRVDLPYECAALFWTAGPGGALKLTGHVQNSADLEALEARYGAALTRGVVARPFPVCSALEALELPLTAQSKPSIRLLSGRQQVAYTQSLAFEIVTPDFYAFLYLAYLQADGTVVNLLPRRGVLRDQHAPFSVLRFGDGQEGRQTYTASAPAGTEAIIGITSRSPIAALEDLEVGATGRYARQDAFGRTLDQALFLELLNQSIEERFDESGGQREISAEVLHLTIVPG